jgi:hypothetical protein
MTEQHRGSDPGRDDEREDPMPMGDSTSPGAAGPTSQPGNTGEANRGMDWQGDGGEATPGTTIGDADRDRQGREGDSPMPGEDRSNQG